MELETCEECKGKGYIFLVNKEYFIRCTKCMGKGKLDWVERITGSRRDIPSNPELHQRIEKDYKEGRIYLDYIWLYGSEDHPTMDIWRNCEYIRRL